MRPRLEPWGLGSSPQPCWPHGRWARWRRGLFLDGCLLTVLQSLPPLPQWNRDSRPTLSRRKTDPGVAVGGDHSSGSPSHSSIGLGQAHFHALPGNPNPEGPLRGFPSRKMHPLEGLVAWDKEMMRAPLFRGTKQSETFPLKERMVLVNLSWRHQGPPVYGVCRVGN